MPIAASIVLVALAVLAYARQLRQAGWLLALRLAIIVLLCLALLDWVLDRQWSRQSRQVAVLFDQSLSMTAGRADSVAGSVAARLQFVPGVGRRDWAFADSAEPIEPQRHGEAEIPESKTQNPKPETGGRTRFAAALRTVLRTRPGAVFIISDGQDNGEEDPVTSAKAGSVPTYTVGCGRVAGPNVAIVDLVVPPEAYAGDTVTVRAKVRSEGKSEIRNPKPENQRAIVRVRGESREIPLGADAADQEVEFSTVFRDPGMQVVRAAVDSIPVESDYADNVREAVLLVRPAKVRVSYVTNRPGPWTRLLAELLRQESRVQLALFASLRSGLEAGDSFEVALLDNVDDLSGGDLQPTIGRVERGAGALVIAGPDFRPGPGLKRLLGAERGPETVTGEFKPVLGTGGRLLPSLGELHLGAVRPFSRIHRLAAPNGAEVWLADSVTGSALVWARRFGQGRVVYVAGEGLWRWGFGASENVERRIPSARTSDLEPRTTNPLQVLLAVAVRYLAESQGKRFELVSDRGSYYSNQPVRLKLMARAADRSPWTGLDVRLTMDSLAAGIPMTETSDGTYEYEMSGFVAGPHEASAVVRVGDSVVGRASTGFAVLQQELELARTGLNRELLARLADETGGRYYPAESVPATAIEPELARAHYRFKFEPRRSPWVYGLIAVLVGVEILLRRRKGLM